MIGEDSDIDMKESRKVLDVGKSNKIIEMEEKRKCPQYQIYLHLC
jgi:hypothetical protein